MIAQSGPMPLATSLPTPVDQPTRLLGGLSPQGFMRRHWQKKPLLVRGALPAGETPVSRDELFALAARDDVESRLLVNDGARWSLRHGPLPRRALPPLGRPGWTVLVQGLDLHVDAAQRLLERFRFVPAARLDDVMVSYASDRGGVGPHFDSYDVFLLQIAGRRRWHIGRTKQTALRENLPLRILREFEPEQEWLLEPGDMLYLPPRWAHDGVAEGGDCMTCSIGFRVPSREDIATELLLRLADRDDGEDATPQLYRDPQQAATDAPGAVPPGLLEFATRALERRLARPQAVRRALGECLSEPKPTVYFDAGQPIVEGLGVRLDKRSRMLYDDTHVFINGQAQTMTRRDAPILRELADTLCLDARRIGRLSPAAREWLDQCSRAGWLRVPHDETRRPR